MPELPEVEVCRQGLLPLLEGAVIEDVRLGSATLRIPFPPGLDAILAGRRIVELRRRGKYLLLACRNEPTGDIGWLIIHLGMSGSLRFVEAGDPIGRHDHFDLLAGGKILRFCDPRRFGMVDWQAGDSGSHPRLAILGIEPLEDMFTGEWLHVQTRNRRQPIKTLLMDARFVVGIGNIYAAEALFRAGISPLRPAGRLGRTACANLVAAIRQTLTGAIAAGGSSIRDYMHSDGGRGRFQLEVAVYGQEGRPCRRCGATIRLSRQSGRSTFYCPGCQK